MVEDLIGLIGKEEELHPDLIDHIDSDSPLGNFLRHPLCVSIYHESMNAYFNNLYRTKRKQADAALKEKNWSQWIGLHERPFRLDALLYIAEDVPVKAYWKVLKHVWLDTEGPSVNQDIWLQLFTRRYPGRRKIMTGKERRTLNNASETNEINIYRGYGEDPNDSIDRKNGLSWTLSYEKAEWFAKRFMTDVGAALDRELETNTKAMIAEAICKKDDVIAYVDGRQEQEIIIDPANIRILRTQEAL